MSPGVEPGADRPLLSPDLPADLTVPIRHQAMARYVRGRGKAFATPGLPRRPEDCISWSGKLFFSQWKLRGLHPGRSHMVRPPRSRTLRQQDFRVLRGTVHGTPRFRDEWRGTRVGLFLLRTGEDVLLPVVVRGGPARLLEAMQVSASAQMEIVGFLCTSEGGGVATRDFYACSTRVLRRPAAPRPEPDAPPKPAPAAGAEAPPKPNPSAGAEASAGSTVTKRRHFPPRTETEKAAALIAGLAAVRRDEILQSSDVTDRAWREALKTANPTPGSDDSLYRAVVGARDVLRRHHAGTGARFTATA